jgi:hypothetical protein
MRVERRLLPIIPIPGGRTVFSDGAIPKTLNRASGIVSSGWR